MCQGDLVAHRLTPTSFAILGLLAIRPWSTYELTRQMQRAIRWVWPRAESNLYEEPKRLEEAGFAASRQRLVGRRPRTEYTITARGRRALEAWLTEPASPTLLESEALLKVLFSNYVEPGVLIGHLERFAAEAEVTDEPWREIARAYLMDEGPFPERLHVNALYWVLLHRWTQLRAEWARWAAEEVSTWPDGSGPRDRAQVKRLLAEALGEDLATD
jgi:DNA-binding PadR family transcriptional regulator